MAWLRGDYLFVFNFHPSTSYEGYGLRVPEGEYELLLNSDDCAFGGFGRVTPAQTFGTIKLAEAHWVRLYLPSRAALVLRRRSAV